MEPAFFAIRILILLFSVIVHEVMHGVAALRFGDRTAERAGRLTLNPIPHIDPIGTILLPGLLIFSGSPILFGWAKPVPVNPLNFSNIRKGELVVAAAGVLSNFGLAIISALLYHLLNTLPNSSILLLGSFKYAVLINLVLGVFNLLPIPPLDGSRILLSQLPYKLAREFEKLERYGIFILLFLMFIPFGPSGSLFQTILGFLVGILSSLLGF